VVVRGFAGTFAQSSRYIAEQDCFVSFASFWEIAIKVSLDKLRLIAQAQEEEIATISRDARFDAYEVKRIW
jgi:PIN domain nuclease of toxin-antitoxin system